MIHGGLQGQKVNDQNVIGLVLVTFVTLRYSFLTCRLTVRELLFQNNVNKYGEVP